MPPRNRSMANLLSLVAGAASAGTGGASLQDILDKAAPGLGFLPMFIRTWLKIDITQMIGILSLFGAMSGGVEFLERLTIKMYWWITRFCTASVSISASDRLNREVLNWLGAQVLTRQGTRILNARSETIQNDAWYYRRSIERNDFRHEKRLPVEYLPTFGTTWFVHRFNVFMVRRMPNPRHGRLGMSEMPDEYAAAPEGNEPLVVMCLGRSANPIKRFLEDCRDFSDRQREEFITIRASKGQYHSYSWDTTILRPIRPLETVHFDEKIKAELVRDIENYLDLGTRKFYNQRGIPYRRGYLLHGPPGTGKTSLSLALAGLFGLELYLLHVPSMSSDRELESLFTSLPPRCIVLLEDIDAVGIKRRSLAMKAEAAAGDGDDDNEDENDDDLEDDRPPPRSTLSGLLNVIDGVASQEGRIVLMTSNMADKLDAALVRPGRIDKMIFLGNVDRESARLMFARMYRSAKSVNAMNTVAVKPAKSAGEAGTWVDVDEEKLAQLAVDFSECVPDDCLTPAMLQGFLLNHRQDPVRAVAEFPAWVKAEMTRMEEAKALAKRLRERRAAKRKERQLKALASLAKEHGMTMTDAKDSESKKGAASKEADNAKASKSACKEKDGEGGEKEYDEEKLKKKKVTSNKKEDSFVDVPRPDTSEKEAGVNVDDKQAVDQEVVGAEANVSEAPSKKDATPNVKTNGTKTPVESAG